MTKQLITLADAAERLSVSERTVRRAVSAGKIPSFGIGRAVRLRADDLEMLIRPITPTGRDV